jgi:hypothetical protein
MNINGCPCLNLGRPVSCVPRLVRAGRHAARSAGAETTYKAISLTPKLRLPTGKMRRGEALSAVFEHPYTGEQGLVSEPRPEHRASASRLLAMWHQVAMFESGLEVWFSSADSPGLPAHERWLRVRDWRAADSFTSSPTLIMRARTGTRLGPLAAVD